MTRIDRTSPAPARAQPCRRLVLLATVLPALALAAGLAAGHGHAGTPQVVVDGPDNEYQIAVVQPWDAPDLRLAVFERLDPLAIGDLWATRSQDGGTTWSEPEPVNGASTAANERHASLVQTGPDRFLLAWLNDAFGYRIHLARAGADLDFQPLGAAQLGWPSAGEINPHLLRLPDGRLLMAYQRLGGGAHVAVSDDDGASWDQGRSPISPGFAALPRLAYRPSDGRLLAMYQTGNNPVTIWSRTSTDPLS